MRRILGVFCVVMMILTLSGCDWFNDPSIVPEPEKEWTIMVWLDGDNNLNDAAIADFHEMEYGLGLADDYDYDLMDNLNVIAQYDGFTNEGAGGDNFNTAPDSTPGRYRVLPANSLYGSSTDLNNKIQNLSEPNMGSASELASFISFCKTYFPAKKYALILWNHGGGVRSIKEDNAPARAICWDDGNDEDALYIGEIKDNLTSEHSVDFLGMDACLMGFLEVAYEFRPDSGDFGADAISFSPATEQGDGWEYQRIFNRFSGSGYYEGPSWGSDPCYDIESLTANQFAGIVAKEYEDVFSNDTWETQTAVDLTKIAAVKSAVDSFAVTLAPFQSQTENIRGAEGTMDLMAYFDESDHGEWLDYAGFDLYELAEQVKYHSSNTALNAAADDLMAAVEDAIIYSWAESSYSGYGTGVESGKNGLAIFFPDGDAMYDSSYTYWDYQFFYSSLPQTEIYSFASAWSSDPYYGALDFCTGDNDGTVDGWYELLQYWFNPGKDDAIHPGPMY